MTKRKLKVEECGDFFKRRTYPQIRIKGQWVKEAFEPGSYVAVEVQPGMVIIRKIDVMGEK